MRMGVITSWTTLLTLLIPGWSGAAPEATSEDPALLDALLANLDSVQRQVEKFTLEQEWTTQMPYIDGVSLLPPGWPKKDLVVDNWARITQDGDYEFRHHRLNYKSVDDKWKAERENIYLVNEKCSAYYFTDPISGPDGPSVHRQLTVWEHHSPSAARDVGGAGSFKIPNILQFAFGTDGTSLSELYRQTTALQEWSVVLASDDSQPVYRITRRAFSKDKSRHSTASFLLSVDEGGMLKRFEDFNSKKELTTLYEIGLKKQESGVWLPEQVHEKHYQDNRMDSTYTLKFLTIEPIKEDYKSGLETLKCPAGTLVIIHSINGTVNRYVISDKSDITP